MIRLLSAAFFLATACIAAAQESIVVLANLEGRDPSMQLETHEVRNLFMGGVGPEGLTPVALEVGDRSRIVFNTHVVGLTESRIQSYWAQMRFSGRSKRPAEFPDSGSLVAHLQNTPGAIGYVDANEPVPEGLTVVYRTE